MQNITGLTRQLGVVFSNEFGNMSKFIGDLVEDNLPDIVAGVTVVWHAFKIWFENMSAGIDVLLEEFGGLTDGVFDEFSALELLIIGISHPFETVLLGLGKIVEKIISTISFPFRKIASMFQDLIKNVVGLIAKLSQLIPDDGKIKKRLDNVVKALDQIEDRYKGDDVTGAFDGLLFGGSQDEFISRMKKTGREVRKMREGVFAKMDTQFKASISSDISTDSDDTVGKISGMATLAVAGSIEAFKLENQTENAILDVNKQQLRELKNMTRQQQLQVAGFTS